MMDLVDRKEISSGKGSTLDFSEVLFALVSYEQDWKFPSCSVLASKKHSTGNHCLATFSVPATHRYKFI